MRRYRWTFPTAILLMAILPSWSLQSAERHVEWEKTLEAAKREGKVVVTVPPSAGLRKALMGPSRL